MDQGTGTVTALYLLVFHGGMAAGSVLWGAVAQTRESWCAFGAAGGLLVTLVAMAWYPLGEREQSNLSPSTHRPDRTAAGPTRASISASALRGDVQL